MNLDDETLMAYADNELSAIDTKRVERAMAEDPALARRVARFVNARRALKKAFDSVLDEPVPDHITKLLDAIPDQPIAPPPSLADERKKRRPIRLGPLAWAAIAASLVFGVFAGRMTAAPSGLFTADGAYAGEGLARVLDTQLANDTQTGAARVGLSFRARDGAICRTFAAESVSGLACRDDGAWAVHIAVASAAAGADYRQAGAPAPEVLEAVDALIDGAPFDAQQERESRDSGWR